MRPFRWQGQRIRTTEDLLGAIRNLTDTHEAQEFRAAYTGAVRTGEPDENLMYLTGYLPAEEAPRARRLLGVTHPFLGDLEPFAERELFQLGVFAAREMESGISYKEAVVRAGDRLRQERGRPRPDWWARDGE